MSFIRYTFGRIVIYSIFSCVLVVVVSVGTIGQTPADATSPVDPESKSIPQPTTLTTDAWGIFDSHTGEVIVGSNLEEKHPIASITKLFTAEAVLSSPKKDETFSVSYGDVLTEGRAGKLAYGDRVTPYELLFPLLIESSNDAAIAIQRELGSDFSDGVTEVKESLTLTHTEILDPSGLSSKDVSTVADLSAFYAYLKNTHPHIIDITQLHTYISQGTGYVNNNPAHALRAFTGGKHGYTDEAKHTFVGTFRGSDSDEDVGIVVLASDDLIHDIETILAYGEMLK